MRNCGKFLLSRLQILFKFSSYKMIIFWQEFCFVHFWRKSLKWFGAWKLGINWNLTCKCHNIPPATTLGTCLYALHTLTLVKSNTVIYFSSPDEQIIQPNRANTHDSQHRLVISHHCSKCSKLNYVGQPVTGEIWPVLSEYCVVM